MGSYSSTTMCQYWDNRLIYWAVYWLCYWHMSIMTHSCVIVTNHFFKQCILHPFYYLFFSHIIANLLTWQSDACCKDCSNVGQMFLPCTLTPFPLQIRQLNSSRVKVKGHRLSCHCAGMQKRRKGQDWWVRLGCCKSLTFLYRDLTWLGQERADSRCQLTAASVE